jgi:hypothetical protein
MIEVYKLDKIRECKKLHSCAGCDAFYVCHEPYGQCSGLCETCKKLKEIDE